MHVEGVDGNLALAMGVIPALLELQSVVWPQVVLRLQLEDVVTGTDAQ